MRWRARLFLSIEFSFFWTCAWLVAPSGESLWLQSAFVYRSRDERVKKVGSICGLRRCGWGRNFKLKCFPRLFRLPNLPTDQASFGLGRSALSQPACRLWRRRTPASPSRRMSGGNRGSGSCLFARCVAPPPRAPSQRGRRLALASRRRDHRASSTLALRPGHVGHDGGDDDDDDGDLAT